ncbi:MAG: hypothetical protein IMY76_04205 [Chloroflexi bacterium]|nr:hypothetical protein [Chloroflexota bacterium]
MTNDLALLHEKVDLLTAQVVSLTEYAEDQQRRQREFDELKQDVIPIANHMIKISIDELAEIGNDFELEDLFYILKRVLRNTHLIETLMDRLESLMGIADETELLGKQVFSTVVEQLDELEHQGYFAFAQQSWKIVERIVTEFDKEDVQALGDNIVIILNTVRNMTQPEIMALANNAVGAIQDDIPEGEQISTWALIRELGNPKVRRGMLRLINLLKTLDNQSK